MSILNKYLIMSQYLFTIKTKFCQNCFWELFEDNEIKFDLKI